MHEVKHKNQNILTKTNKLQRRFIAKIIIFMTKNKKKKLRDLAEKQKKKN